MKIIHTGDVHLGSKMDSRFPKEISEMRKTELRNTFWRLVSYAADNGVSVILLSGDVFDSDRPFRRDVDFFLSAVRGNPQIDFLYLRGNHDAGGAGIDPALPNLKCFSEDWTEYSYGDVCVSGIELSDGNSSSLYSGLRLKRDRFNVVMMHGQTGGSEGEINLRRLRGRNIDYLALGHVHKPSHGSLDERGVWAYCGCLEGRGFDETGPRGFYLLDTGKGNSPVFVPFSERVIEEDDVSVEGASNAYEAVGLIKRQVALERGGIYRINLTGSVSVDMGVYLRDIETNLSRECAYVSVRDRTRRILDLKRYERDSSVRGEFVRAVSASKDYTDEEKARIIDAGLAALDGREVDL